MHSSTVFEKHALIYSIRYDDTSNRCEGIFHLFNKWNASVLKLIWHNLLIFILLYTCLTLAYRFILVEWEKGKEIFEIICIYCSR